MSAWTYQVYEQVLELLPNITSACVNVRAQLPRPNLHCRQR